MPIWGSREVKRTCVQGAEGLGHIRVARLHRQNQDSKRFRLPQKVLVRPLRSILFLLAPRGPDLLCVTRDGFVVWNYPTCALYVWLLTPNLPEIHPCGRVYRWFVQFYSRVASLCTMSHGLFIQSSVVEPLACLHFFCCI